MKAFLFASLLVIGTAAHAQDQFDLSCEGTRSMNDMEVARIEDHFRIDLAALRYCGADCRELRQINRVSDGRIDLEVLAVGNGASAMEASGAAYFDRAASRYHNDMVIRYTMSRGSPRRTMHVVEDLACTVGPFSGFPTPPA
jgi:hypothetical protein